MKNIDKEKVIKALYEKLDILATMHKQLAGKEKAQARYAVWKQMKETEEAIALREETSAERSK